MQAYAVMNGARPIGTVMTYTFAKVDPDRLAGGPWAAYLWHPSTGEFQLLPGGCGNEDEAGQYVLQTYRKVYGYTTEDRGLDLTPIFSV